MIMYMLLDWMTAVRMCTICFMLAENRQSELLAGKKLVLRQSMKTAGSLSRYD